MSQELPAETRPVLSMTRPPYSYRGLAPEYFPRLVVTISCGSITGRR
jgi:hypothetical protein